MPSKKSKNQILEIARNRFGLDSLRPGQEEAVQSVLSGQDTLIVQPTGSGKSAIYQIAGLLMDGSTVVVSPLIALQKDQVESINAQNAAEAVVVNSTQRVGEFRDNLAKIEQGEVEYIFLAPEQLSKPETVERLKPAKISLFVVDEAHCVSQWGHNFRPDFLELKNVIEQLGHPTVLAMTATASGQVRNDIVEQLGMRNPQVFVRGFNRPNISLRVDAFPTEAEKLEALVHRIRWASKPGIVYVATRKTAEQIMSALNEEGITSLFYHGGLRAKERAAAQEQFMSGEAEVIIATNAFGMGIDKADVRFVYHYDIPDSLDSYYQEIGRAGRDGEKSEAVLFYRPENIGVQKFRAGEGKLKTEQVEKVTDIIAQDDGPVAPKQIAEQADLSQKKVATLLHRLEDVGAVEKLPTGEVQLTSETDMAETVAAAEEQDALLRESRREKLQKMQEYAETASCRREFLLQYFGDDFSGPCHTCDNCDEADPGAKVDSSGVGTRREVA